MRKRRFSSLLISIITVFTFCAVILYFENYFINDYNNGSDSYGFPSSLKHKTVVKNVDGIVEKIIDATYEKSNEIDNNLIRNNNRNSHENEDYCSYLNNPPNVDIQMLKLYEEMKFDNVDGGVWKQGWNIKVSDQKFSGGKKLKVFVVPHSHNDPGWLKTIDEYYLEMTRNLLNNILKKLEEDRRRTFMWAEISYFSMWWNDLNPERREALKRVISNKQLEIVTGGWVMNDEANSHWLSVVHQLSEGHQWLHKNLNYTPKSHWSNDPFGLSPTQAMVLKKSGFQNMVIQRVHYAVKKQLALNKNLEFRWKQPWDKIGSSEIFTQIMPFYFYDIPHTCGPDPKVCCQFDFKRFPKYKVYCPWKIAPQYITEQNVAERAELLLDQYKKKSMLFKTNSLFIPLGDDFRFTLIDECDDQYNNYQKLFDYMNKNEDMNVQIKFATMSDYFDSVHEELKDELFPTLSGDFFTYSDVDDNYWSGYYTSRPFYKRMDRILLHYLRAAEIITSLAKLSQKYNLKWDEIESKISTSRQSLALFQHHDGITGTAKNHVVLDYGRRLFSSINDLQNVIGTVVKVLLTKPGDTYKIDDVWTYFNGLPSPETIDLGVGFGYRNVIIYNTLPYEREQVVTFTITTPYIQVIDDNGKKIRCQVNQVLEESGGNKLKYSSVYELAFVAKVEPLGLTRYVIKSVEESQIPVETSYGQNTIYNYDYNLIEKEESKQIPVSFDIVKLFGDSKQFSIENDHLLITFQSNGFLKSVTIDSEVIPIQLEFAKYNTHRSGAYLFNPDGSASSLDIPKVPIKVTTGSIFSKVEINLPDVKHVVRLFNHPGAKHYGIEVENVVDVTKTYNFELIMKLSTNIRSGDEFFTDLNDYQIIRRKRFEKLPLQANYYPMPSMAHIEDERYRLSILTSTPLGCSSLKEGQLEIMQDRRLNQDDFRGIEQGVTDNRPTRHVFKIVLEKREPGCYSISDDHPSSFPTVSAHLASQTLLNPLVKLIQSKTEFALTDSISYRSPHITFGVDYTLPVLRSGITVNKKNYVGITLHKRHLDYCFEEKDGTNSKYSRGKVNLKNMFAAGSYLTKSSLTYLHLYERREVEKDIEFCDMEIETFLYEI